MSDAALVCNGSNVKESTFEASWMECPDAYEKSKKNGSLLLQKAGSKYIVVRQLLRHMIYIKGLVKAGIYMMWLSVLPNITAKVFLLTC